MCNNLKRALYLSLRYQFVTPLTSLVVVKPDSVENGDIKEADMFNRKIRLMSKGVRDKNIHTCSLYFALILTVVNYI